MWRVENNGVSKAVLVFRPSGIQYLYLFYYHSFWSTGRPPLVLDWLIELVVIQVVDVSAQHMLYGRWLSSVDESCIMHQHAASPSRTPKNGQCTKDVNTIIS